MRSRRFARLLFVCLGSLVVSLLCLPMAVAQPAAQMTSPPTDEQLLKDAGLEPTAAALLELFRKRSAPETDAAKLLALVHQLGDGAPENRAEAARQLMEQGTAAIPVLRAAANDLDDSETARRARQCLSAIEGNSGATLMAAAVRLLARQRPAGAVAALLAYLPFAENDRVSDEIARVLPSLAGPEGDAGAVASLVQALRDRIPMRRALAAEVLSRVGGPTEQAAVRQLLQDPKPTVRLRVALVLAEARDPEAIPALIGVLDALPPTQTREVEDHLTQLAGEWAVAAPTGNDEVARRLRREVWSAWWRTLDGNLVLAELTRRALSDVELEKAQELIRALHDKQAAVRDKAMNDLLTMGANVVPLLRRAANQAEASNAQPLQQCLQLFLSRGLDQPLPAAAARLLAIKRPPGSVEALLAHLPLAEGDGADLAAALKALAIHEGKPDAALLRALGDTAPQRRAVAAEIICQAAGPDFRAAVRPLLKDPDAAVRTRAALALAATREKDAVPVLIALLGELSAEQAGAIDDYLHVVAGEQAPVVALGTDEAGRQKCRDAWAAWWKDKGEHLNLPRLDGTPQLLGYTLIVDQYDPVRQSGRVFEVDAAGKTRWSIQGLQGPTDAQIVSGDHVLIVEQNLSRVSEQDLEGKVVWERSVANQVLSAQRLPNGNTFIATRGQLLEVDKNGKEVLTHNRPSNDIMTARKLRDGQVAFITYSWQYYRLDANGKEQKTTHIGGIPFTVTNPPSVEILANDRILVAHYQANKVAEHDLNGKVVWESAAPAPLSVSRLPNGNTLVASGPQQRVTELDRSGKVVWEYKENVRPWRAKRR